MKNLFTVTALLGFLLGMAQDKTVDEIVTEGKIKGHLSFLASDLLKGRDTPSEGQKIAAEYIKTRFQVYGVKTAPGMDGYFQPVPMKTVKSGQGGVMAIGETSLGQGSDFLLIDGKDAEFDAEIVFVNYGSEKDFKKKKLEGKIAVAICGDGQETSPQKWFTMSEEKRKLAKEKGALGLIELYNSKQLPWTFLVRFLGRDRTLLDESKDDSDLVHIWVNDSNNDRVETFKQKKAAMKLKVAGGSEKKFEVKNVVGVVEGTDPKLKNEYVIYSAHYDHVGIGQPDDKGDSIYNGARDNAVGTTTVLTMAENLAKYPTKRSALFILFTGEEKGLLGSRWFADNSPIDLKNIVYCFNSDNGGYNDTSVASIIGLTRTTAQPEIEKACTAYGLKAIEDQAPEQGLFDRSDNVNFAVKGIPAPTFSLGFTAFDEEIGKYYHRPADSPESLDYEYLLKFFRSYVYTGRLIGNLSTRPFWVEGDKYYKAGKKLYEQ